VANDDQNEDGGPAEKGRSNFIREIIEEDLESGKHDEIVTRFPPEPNGYLHIGHTMSVVLNYGIAQDYDGRFHLRFDDTNPTAEEEEYVESLKRDVAWLGADWGEHLYYASEYFERMYELAERLIEKGKAYVDSLPAEEIREQRGSWDEPGEESPYRDRSVEKNLELFRRMRDGDFEEGEHVLRAKIDMQHDNTLMRDPVMYRILHRDHPHVGGDWCIYPMYDYAHCLEDAFEGITHSLCTLEFENNRELYNWFVRETEVEHQPRQIEFAGMQIGYTVVSKSRLRELVEEGYVDGWDDPRMPTVAGLRRRGVKPSAIWSFVQEVGVARNDKRVEIQQFEHAIRDDLNTTAPRVQCVRDPLKVTVENFEEDETDWIEAPHYPEDVPGDASRMLPFTRELYIDRDDFREDPPQGYYRLSPGEEVRLRYGYFVTCEEVVRDDDGEVVELRCSYDPETRGGAAPDDRDVQGTIHWVSADHGVSCELRLYDRLFEVPNPRGHEDRDFKEFVNSDSLVVTEGVVEPSVHQDSPGTRYQFERDGYYMIELEDSSADDLVFNRIVPLRDTWKDEEAERRKREARERAREKSERKERKKREAERARERRRDAMFAYADGREVNEAYEPTARDRQRREHDVLADRLRDYEERGLGLDSMDLLSGSLAVSEYFEEQRELSDRDAGEVAASITNKVLPLVDHDPGTEAFDGAFEELERNLKPEANEAIDTMVEEGRITSDAAQTVREKVSESGEDPESVVEAEDLEAITDEGELRALIDEVFETNEEQLEEYAGGKTKLFGYFVGQVMRATDGRADPEAVRRLLGEELPDPDED